jgi:hypothetical protein
MMMTGNELHTIKAEAQQAKGRLTAPYAALKTLVSEKTGKKDCSFTMRVSDADLELAEMMADELGISVASLYRHLAKLAFQEWGKEQAEAEDAEDKAKREAFDAEMEQLIREDEERQGIY